MNRHAPGGPGPDDTVASPPRRGPGENPFAGLALLLAVAGVVPALRTVAWALAALSGALAIGFAVGRAGAGRAQLGMAVGVVVLTFLATPPPNRGAYRGTAATPDTVASEPVAAEAPREPDTPDAAPGESEEPRTSPAPPEPRPAERVAAREPEPPRERPKPKAAPRPKPKPAPRAARTEPKSRPAPTASRTEPKSRPAPTASRTERTHPRAAPPAETRRSRPAEVATRSTPRTTEPRAPRRTEPRRTPDPPVEAPVRRTPEAPPRRPPPVAAPTARELSEIRGDLAVAQVLKNQGAYYDAGVTLRNAQQSVSALSARYPGSPAVSELSQRVRILAAENRRACFAEAAVFRSRGEATSPCP